MAAEPNEKKRDEKLADIHRRKQFLERHENVLRDELAPNDCRSDGRCQYAIDHGAEGLGHCPPGKCAMPIRWTYGHYGDGWWVGPDHKNPVVFVESATRTDIDRLVFDHNFALAIPYCAGVVETYSACYEENIRNGGSHEHAHRAALDSVVATVVATRAECGVNHER